MVFSIEGLTTSNAVIDQLNTAAEYVDNVQMEETGNDEIPDGAALSEGTEETISSASSTGTYSSTTAINSDSGHHNHAEPEMLYTHLMVDIEAFGKRLTHQSYLSGPCFLIHQQVIPARNFTK